MATAQHMDPEIQFFIGKGGVGKSTTSAVAAIQLARNARDTLLVSMDPAHNQCDIFQKKFSEKPKRVADHLHVKEVDVDYWIEKYLEKTEKTIKQTYTYESAFNLQNYFNVLQFSPGLEEYALLLAFENVLHTYKNKDIIIFDMAPTALTLRFFCLPSITLIWLEELVKLRNQIYAKKEIISKIKVFGKEIEQDKIKDKLKRLIHEYEHLRDHFLAAKTRINLVMNDDDLSFSEAFRIKQKLKDIGIDIAAVVINKMQHNKIPAKVKDEFKTQKIALFPLSAKNLLGYEVLNEYINLNLKTFLCN
ncbi:MAG: ArsA family ATPase [Desulfobacterales bacterium]